MPSESQINCYFCSVALNIASCRGDGMARSFFCKSIARALALFLVCGLWNKTSRSIRPKGFFHSRGWGESNPEMTPLIRNQRLHCSQVEHPYGLCYLPFYSNHGSPMVTNGQKSVTRRCGARPRPLRLRGSRSSSSVRPRPRSRPTWSRWNRSRGSRRSRWPRHVEEMMFPHRKVPASEDNER